MSGFQGWGSPKENWFKTPKALIHALPLIETVSELKILNYVICHTWGYHDYLGSKLITMDEFENGRKRKDGSRIDGGTGLTINSIRDGIARAVEHGLLQVIEDDRDAARKKRYYKLADDPAHDDESGESLLPNSDGDGQSVSNSEDQTLILTAQTLILKGSKFDPRTEKEDLERNSFKESTTRASGEIFSEERNERPTASAKEQIDFSALPENDPRRVEHLRGLGIVPAGKKQVEAGKTKRLIVNNEGLTQALRTALVNELIEFSKAQDMIALGNEEDLMSFQRLAEELYRMGVDSPEKMKALGVAWWADNKILPNRTVLLRFQSKILDDIKNNNGESSLKQENRGDATTGRGRGKSTQHGSGHLAEWESKHGEITWESEQVPPKTLNSWPASERREYHRKRTASRPEQASAGDSLFSLPEWYTQQSGTGANGEAQNLI